ncbi:capsid protein VP2 [Megabat bufavirus 1]|nr:capsid protein VP2 [Megabat bufavirus 1]BAU69606.1 capsid protein VP2 [Megabat bufavirus 1]
MSDNGTDEPDQPAATETAARGSGASGGGGGGGVGHSTGSYSNRTNFIYEGDTVHIICNATRQIHLNMASTEEYKIYETEHGSEFPTDPSKDSGRGTYQDSYHAKVETPWRLIHANAWGCWFSPADWQQVLTTCRDLEIVSFEQSIENIVIKTVATQGTGIEETKTYNNDLTALLEVAQDNSNILPWVSDNMYMDSIGYVPWRACRIPEYCYHVDFTNTIDLGGQAGWPQAQAPGKTLQRLQQINWRNIQFITVENTVDIEMLRTGDAWNSGKYHFPKVKPASLEYHWQSTRHTGAPHPTTSPNQEGQKAAIVDPGCAWQWGDHTSANQSASTQVKNFHIGYGWPEWQFHYGTGGPSVNPGPPYSQTPWGRPYDSQTPRLTAGASDKAIFDYQHGEDHNQERDTWWDINAKMTGQMNWAPQNMHIKELKTGVPSADSAWFDSYHNTFGPFTAVDDKGPVYPWGAIWGKQPNTTHKPMMSAHAPYLIHGPPGQLLVKIAQNLTDQYINTGSNYPRIQTYATLWWKGQLKFKAKLRTPRQWNCYNLPGIPEGQPMSKYVPNAIGQFEIPYMPGRSLPNFTI